VLTQPAKKISIQKLIIKSIVPMNAVGLLLTAELWKSTMSVKQLEMVQIDHAANASGSLADITRETFVQHAKRISIWKTKVNYLG
jgi:hypothetical protein